MKIYRVYLFNPYQVLTIFHLRCIDLYIGRAFLWIFLVPFFSSPFSSNLCNISWQLFQKKKKACNGCWSIFPIYISSIDSSGFIFYKSTNIKPAILSFYLLKTRQLWVPSPRVCQERKNLPFPPHTHIHTYRPIPEYLWKFYRIRMSQAIRNPWRRLNV